jgi:hypothetical protein
VALVCLKENKLTAWRRRWEDNIKRDIVETRIDGVDCIPLAQDRVRWLAFVNKVMNLCVP